jgi:chloramphenicol-sensitive protein RarD
MIARHDNTPEEARRGFFFALSAYLLWGFLPFYMKAVAHIPVLEVLAHRIVWSVPLAGVILLALGRTADIRAAFANPRTLAYAALTAAIISVNWGVYVWAIGAGRAIETALGYYINPLFSVFLGSVFLGERLTGTQLVAIALAVVAVAIITWDAGGLPVVSLALAISWGFYALAKRTLPVGPAQGFFLEVLILSIPSLAWIAYIQATGQGKFLESTGNLLLLGSAGFVTAIPLILYATGAKGLRLSTIGIMQYIAPSMIFLIAVFIFREPFSIWRFAAFACIWVALMIYTLPLLRDMLATRREGAVTSVR